MVSIELSPSWLYFLDNVYLLQNQVVDLICQAFNTVGNKSMKPLVYSELEITCSDNRRILSTTLELTSIIRRSGCMLIYIRLSDHVIVLVSGF